MRIPLDPPPGLWAEDTSFTSAGRWGDGSNVRFWRGRPQVIAGWERMTDQTLNGVCRGAFGWTDQAGVQTFAFGTHLGLYIWRGGGLYTVSPAGLAPGLLDGVGGQGFGTGTYSFGKFSEPASGDTFPRTWSFGAWGETLLASPRGGSLYAWSNDPGALATAVVGAPSQITQILTAPTDQVFALGCNEEVSGVFNPLCLRHSSVRKSSEWITGTATTAREYILPGGGRIVGGRVIGAYLLVWTNHALFLGRFIGSVGQPWRFERVGERCGLIGPQAAVVSGQTAYWLGPDLQFYRYDLGGAAEVLPCSVRRDVVENLAASQGDKICASTTSLFGEVRWDYPDQRDGVENSRYVLFSTLDGAWSRGDMARTAMIDAGPAAYPVGVDPQGAVYYHERGHSADGAAFSWFIETADQVLDEDRTVMARGIWPDLADQAGPVRLSLFSRLTPQGDVAVSGPFALAPGQDRVDFRATGRLFKIRFAGGSAPTACRIGKPVFNVAVAGAR